MPEPDLLQIFARPLHPAIWTANSPASSFPNSVWERDGRRNSVSVAGRRACGDARTGQRSCADKCVPKRSLGTRQECGGGEKHVRDIRRMLELSEAEIDRAVLEKELSRRNLISAFRTITEQ